MLSQVYFRVNLRIDFLPATIIMRIENIFSLSVSDATLPKPTLEIIKVIKRKMVMIVVPSTNHNDALPTPRLVCRARTADVWLVARLPHDVLKPCWCAG